MASLPLFFEEVPEFETRGDFMLVSWEGFQIAMPVTVCKNAVLKCEAEIAKWHISHLSGAQVVPFRREH